MKKFLAVTLTLLLTFTILSGIVALIGDSFSFVPNAFAEKTEPGWLELHDKIICHCPDESHWCECVYEEY